MFPSCLPGWRVGGELLLLPLTVHPTRTPPPPNNNHSSVIIIKINNTSNNSFTHSFRQFYRDHSSVTRPSSSLILRGAPDTARILCRSFTPKRHRQLWVNDLLKVPTWRREQDSNPRPFGRKASNLPMSHHAPQCNDKYYSTVLFQLALVGSASEYGSWRGAI